MRSSTTPPLSLQIRVYCAWPGAILFRSLVRQRLRKSADPGPVTVALPRWLTSNSPTACRTAACSVSTPAPAYSRGIDQPPNAANFAPAALCRSCSGDDHSSSPTPAPSVGYAREPTAAARPAPARSEEHTSELQ